MKNTALKFMMAALIMATLTTNIHYAILGYGLGDKNNPGNVMAQDSTGSNGSSNGGNSNDDNSNPNSSSQLFSQEQLVDCFIPGNPSHKGTYIRCVVGWAICIPTNCTVN
ncbi:hypothetical protein [Pedobacter suwonensis]|uniref:hypothetical protein n=1 Tax=Pedobacter suwonensis TaxID=332999 RepID=UPI00119DEB74|nr:hypothetical protein [Pedobacter suwonensis]